MAPAMPPTSLSRLALATFAIGCFASAGRRARSVFTLGGVAQGVGHLVDKSIVELENHPRPPSQHAGEPGTEGRAAVLRPAGNQALPQRVEERAARREHLLLTGEIVKWILQTEVQISREENDPELDVLIPDLYTLVDHWNKRAPHEGNAEEAHA
jgi:hypothetical protein